MKVLDIENHKQGNYVMSSSIFKGRQSALSLLSLEQSQKDNELHMPLQSQPLS